MKRIGSRRGRHVQPILKWALLIAVLPVLCSCEVPGKKEYNAGNRAFVEKQWEEAIRLYQVAVDRAKLEPQLLEDAKQKIMATSSHLQLRQASVFNEQRAWDKAIPLYEEGVFFR